MRPKPIRVFYSALSGRFYATRHYKWDSTTVVVITGEKFDVTDDIGAAVNKYDLEFTKRANRENTHE